MFLRACLLLSLAPAAALEVTNLTPGETLRYPVALLVGTAPGPRLAVVNEHNDRPDGRAEVTVASGRFRALVELRPGLNRLRLTSGAEQFALELTYQPQSNPRQVTLVYLTGADGDASFPGQTAPEPDYETRLRCAGRLLQTFCAEALAETGHGRLTFRLEEDDEGRPVVRTIKLPEDRAALQARDPGEQWQRTNNLLFRQFNPGRTKILALNGFIAYNPATRQAPGHTALGGGSLAVFSANSLSAWPTSLADVERAFGDATPVDVGRVMDDTAGRGTVWSLAATGLGAWLHELGHTFGLPHDPDGRCIMNRGFDRFNRTFVPVEAPRRGRTEPLLVEPGQTAWWTPRHADRLALDPWFQPDGYPADDRPGPSLRLDWATGELVIEAPAGLALLQAERGDRALAVDLTPADRPTTFRLSRTEFRRRAEAPEGAGLLAVDAVGRVGRLDERNAKNPAWFLDALQFAATPLERRSPEPPPVDPATLARELASRPLTPRPEPTSPYFDLNRHYGARYYVIAYARREFTSATERPIKLLAGGDDGCRVWLNGALVLAESGHKVVPLDGATGRATLRAGVNELLVETQQGPGDWTLALRLTDDRDRPLLLDGEGRLVAAD